MAKLFHSHSSWHAKQLHLVCLHERPGNGIRQKSRTSVHQHNAKSSLKRVKIPICSICGRQTWQWIPHPAQPYRHVSILLRLLLQTWRSFNVGGGDGPDRRANSDAQSIYGLVGWKQYADLVEWNMLCEDDRSCLGTPRIPSTPRTCYQVSRLIQQRKQSNLHHLYDQCGSAHRIDGKDVLIAKLHQREWRESFR